LPWSLVRSFVARRRLLGGIEHQAHPTALFNMFREAILALALGHEAIGHPELRDGRVDGLQPKAAGQIGINTVLIPLTPTE
jgi:hypothetical protein